MKSINDEVLHCAVCSSSISCFSAKNILIIAFPHTIICILPKERERERERGHFMAYGQFHRGAQVSSYLQMEIFWETSWF
jgi:hypothetical protein